MRKMIMTGWLFWMVLWVAAQEVALPTGKGRFPVVVLIDGDGVMADALVHRGIAVLRYDSRGKVPSTRDTAKATPADGAAAVEAAVQSLKTRKEINPRHIGLIGLSQGGLIAPMVAAKDGDIRFVVLLAAPGLPGGKYPNYDPAPVLEEVQCRLLAMVGAKDTVVIPEDNLVAIARALDKGGNRRFEVKEFPDVTLEQDLPPVALEFLVNWVVKQAR